MDSRFGEIFYFLKLFWDNILVVVDSIFRGKYSNSGQLFGDILLLDSYFGGKYFICGPLFGDFYYFSI